MSVCKAVAFDCDGVMFDSAKANTAYYNRILNSLGKPDMTSEQFAFAQMHTADRVLAYLCPGKGWLEQARQARRQVSYLPFVRYMEIEPSLKPLLEWLKPRYKTAIATNRTDTIGRVLSDHGLEAFFDLVIGAGDVQFPKPHPEPLLRILQHFDLQPAELIYVGDSELDEKAAQAADVPLVAYNNRSLAAAYHITGLIELRAILEDGDKGGGRR
jgi:HAD superfamily hydrolase (TIGR01549 family)